MGLKTIQAQYDADRKQFDQTIGAFVKQAKTINEKLASYKTKLDEISKISEQMATNTWDAHKEAKALNTHGIVQLDDVKKLLIMAAENGMPHPIKLDEILQLEKSIQDQIKKNLEAMIQAYTDKRTAAWPAKLEVGMTFKEMRGVGTVEVLAVGQPVHGKPPVHKVRWIKSYWTKEVYESNMEADRLTPKGWKYIKT